jgi:hypothetical protein
MNIYFKSVMFFIISICLTACSAHKAPNPVTEPSFTAVPTPRFADASGQTLPAVTDVSSTVVKSCITTNTNTCLSSTNTSVITYDGADIWVSEKSPCAVVAVYDTLGNELLNRSKPAVFGISHEQERDYIWLSYTDSNDALKVKAYKRGDYDAGEIEGFSIDKDIMEQYYGLEYNEGKLWMIKRNIEFAWEINAFDVNGNLTDRILMPPPPGSGYYMGITLGGGYIWVSGFYINGAGDTISLIYKTTGSGIVESISYTGEKFLGIDMVDDNTFWIACWNNACRISY